jgi:hypothetical protein
VTPSTGHCDQCVHSPHVSHVRWVPCHHGMARPQVADGGDGLQIWRAAANVSNKQSRTSEKRWSISFGAGREANSSPSLTHSWS